MTASFSPGFDILPDSQKILWPELGQVPKHFVLYGGTAIALRLNHRQSVDFDFFSSRRMDPDSFFANVPFAEGAQILQQEENTLTLLVDRKGPVKLSFFWGLKVGRLSHPEETRDGVLIVASMQDLFAHKLKVILQRVDVKDYQDIAAILEAGYPLSMGISGAKSLWPRFPVMDCLRTLCYFKEGNFQALSVETRKQLITASAGVESGQICEMNVSYPLSPSDPPHRPQKGGSGL